MAINIEVIANRLAQMRATLGYRLEDVSNIAGFDIDRLKDLEAGKIKPTGDEVLILADLYKCNFISLVDESLPSPAERTDPLFRRYGSSFSFEDRRAIQEFVFLCQRESILENLLDIKASQVEFRVNPQGSFYKKHGWDAAQNLREKLNYKPNQLPLDIYRDFRRLGIHIFRRKLNNREISGLYINDAIAGHCVLINYDEDIYRQRFSVAHEVAHAIFDSKESYVLSLKKDSSFIEIRANNFASSYLAPLGFIQQMPKLTRYNVQEWSNNMRISTQALAIAFLNAKLINKQEYNEIKSIRIDATSKIDPEIPNTLTPKQRIRRKYMLEQGLSTYYVDLCFDAYEKDLISSGYLVESLGIGYSDLGEVCTIYGRTIKRDF